MDANIATELKEKSLLALVPLKKCKKTKNILQKMKNCYCHFPFHHIK